jgi:ribosome-binding factor A
MSNRSGRMPSQRQLRVGEEMRHVLAQVLARGELRDPVLQDRPITVTEVRVSPDLKHAVAFVVPLGGTGEVEILAALRRSAPYLRGVAAQALNLRYAPQIGFEKDRSFDEARRIADVLRQPVVQRDLVAEEPEAPEPDDL